MEEGYYSFSKYFFKFTGADVYVKGTKTVKLNNFRDHVTKSVSHQTAARRLGEIRRESGSTTSTMTNSGVPRQATVLTHMQKLSTRHFSQLTKKFQLAHFVVSKAKSFKLYSDIAKFEKDIHKVDLGDSYTSDTSCAEMVKYLSKSAVIKEITEPINNNQVNYYSIMNDGSSSAKTMDKKELFLIKTAAAGVPKFL